MTSNSSDQHYNLKWTNHTNNILQMFSEHLQKEHLVDVTLSCEGKFLKAHKMVLSSCSPYFQEVFKVHTAEHPLIIMHGVKFSTLQHMIDFMYQGEIRVGDADLDDLLVIAENMQIKGLCKIRRDKHNLGKDEDAPKKDLPPEDSTTPSSPPRPRKRRKQSFSPLNVSTDNSSDSHVNGDNASTQEEMSESDQQEAKAPKLAEDADKQYTKIPRPPNAFMIFANEWRKKLAQQYTGESNKEISVRLGNMWKSLTASAKDKYYSAARKADEDHKVKYPGYYYSPKEARLRKEMRVNNQRPPTPVLQSGSIVKNFDTSSLVKLVMPDDQKCDRTVKHEPDVYQIQEVNDTSNSSEENQPSTSFQKS